VGVAYGQVLTEPLWSLVSRTVLSRHLNTVAQGVLTESGLKMQAGD
jgi:hypothetical protein